MNPEHIILEIIDKYKLIEDKEIIQEELSNYDNEGVEGTSYYDECREFVSIYWLKKYRKLYPEIDEALLLQIIICYLNIKDFAYAFEYMDEYISLGYCKSDDLENCKKEIKNVLKNISEYIREIVKKNIVIHWIDALDYADYNKIEFLDEMCKDALVFSNSYTVTPYTSSAMRTIFSKGRVIEDKFYDMGLMDEKNSVLLKMLKEKEIAFKYISSERKNYFVEKYNCQFGTAVSQSLLYWKLIQEMCQNDKPTVYLLHEVYTTHPPFINGLYDEDTAISIKGYDNSTIIQKKTALVYESVQLKFYHNLIGDAKYDIYMSDHGGSVRNSDKYHTTLLIKGLKRRGVEERLFSYIDFSDLLKCLIEDKEENIDNLLQRDFVPIEDEDYYSRTRCVNAIAWGFSKIGFLVAYRGIHTKDAIYTIRRTGEEAYLRTSNGVIVDTVDVRAIASDKLAEMRSKAGSWFPNLEESNHFECARLINKYAIPNYHKRIESINKIVKDFIDELYTDGEKIAIRGGGIHTKHLLKLFPDTSIIACIIDNNPAAINFGEIKCVDAEGAKQIAFSTILISSYKFRELFLKDARATFSNKKIIDIYEIINQEGITINQGFYGEEIIECCDLYGNEQILNMKNEVIERINKIKK